MAAFRVRVRTTEIDLPPGELVVGRASESFLRIDDDLVSRRHARLLVSESAVVFEDLGSRNGSRVNGARITGSVTLKLGDRFEVGNQSFQLITGVPTTREPTMTMAPMRACRACQVLIDWTASECPHCGAAQPPELLPSGGAMPFRDPAVPPGGDEVTSAGPAPPPDPKGGPAAPAGDAGGSFGSSLVVMIGLVDKLLTLGRSDDAERMFAPRLREALTRAQAGENLGPTLPGEVLARATKLATVTGQAEWYAWVFRFAAACHRRLDDKLIDELHANMLVHRPPAAAALAVYALGLAGDDGDSLQHRRRLEALQRFCRDG